MGAQPAGPCMLVASPAAALAYSCCRRRPDRRGADPGMHLLPVQVFNPRRGWRDGCWCRVLGKQAVILPPRKEPAPQLGTGRLAQAGVPGCATLLCRPLLSLPIARPACAPCCRGGCPRPRGRRGRQRWCDCGAALACARTDQLHTPLGELSPSCWLPLLRPARAGWLPPWPPRGSP